MQSYEINLLEWFDARKIEYCPKHFTRTNTPITEESELWIEEKLLGRYAYFSREPEDGFFHVDVFPAFEDSKEAIFYELTWSK